jgi:hypothetical protein
MLPLGVFGLAFLGAFWCNLNHICMDGHMQHPPFPAWHYPMDVLWFLAVPLAPVLMWRRSPRWMFWITLPVIVLIVLWMFSELDVTHWPGGPEPLSR